VKVGTDFTNILVECIEVIWSGLNYVRRPAVFGRCEIGILKKKKNQLQEVTKVKEKGLADG